jgi:hypothetical protein
MAKDNFRRVFFFYALPATVVPLNGQIGQQLTIAGDYDFEMHYILAQSTSPLVTVQMFDAAAGGAGFQSAAVPLPLFSGTAQLPLAMIPQTWKKRQQFTFTFVDTSGVNNTVNLVFFGYKLIPA